MTAAEPLPTFGPDDDALHAPGDKHSWTETSWWSFNVPERDLGGWLYVQVRPHQDSTAGGAFVWDSTASLPWELPYYGWFTHQKLRPGLDLRHARLDSGVGIDVVEPGMVYDLAYRFRDEDDFVADLRFEGLVPPFPYLSGTPPFSASSHFDQPGRITGTIRLRGEDIAVDCLSVRDRSWGPRPEHWSRGGRLSYAFGTFDERTGFLAFCAPVGDDPFSDEERLTTGYLLRDGVMRRLTAGVRRNVRDAGDGMVRQITLSLQDEAGRSLDVEGVSVSRMVLPRHRITYNSLVHWQADGGLVGHGEDQDLWPIALTADRVRGACARSTTT